MSLQDAISQATRQTLSHYLAADLVEQLSDEIVHRVAPEAERAVQSFLGFAHSRTAATRTKSAAQKARALPAKRSRRNEQRALDDGAGRTQELGAPAEEREPTPAEMS